MHKNSNMIKEEELNKYMYETKSFLKEIWDKHF